MQVLQGEHVHNKLAFQATRTAAACRVHEPNTSTDPISQVIDRADLMPSTVNHSLSHPDELSNMACAPEQNASCIDSAGFDEDTR